MVHPIILVGDNIRSSENVGALFRIADGIGAMAVYLTGISGYPDMGSDDPRRPYLRNKVHSKIQKTALAALDNVPFHYFESNIAAIEDLKMQGSHIFCVEQDSRAVDYRTEYRVSTPLALVFGNELLGVSNEFLNVAEKILYIPQYGVGKSLNVSVAAGIAAYHILWQI